jgi:Hint domain
MGGFGYATGGYGGAGASLTGGTLTNFGTITGGPGAGSGSAVDALYLASGSSTGTLSGLATQFIDFSQVTVGVDAAWALAGPNTIASGVTLTELGGPSLKDIGTLVNNGSIVLDPSTMTLAALIGTGSVTIDAGSTLGVQGTISGSETIVFGGSGAYLHLESPGSTAGSVSNFASGEVIDLTGADPATVSYASGQLKFSGCDISLALANGGTLHAGRSGDGVAVSVVLCFCANTLILTPSGERPVQELAVGDLVTTHGGAAYRVALRRIALRLGTRFRVIEAADGALSEAGGFYPFEQANGLRWTNGDAALPAALFAGVEGPIELVLHVGGITVYPLLGPGRRSAAG